MNIVALLSAIIGLSTLILIIVLGNKIQNRWLRYLSVVVGIVMAVVITGDIPPLLGVEGYSTSEKAGKYLFYLGLIAAIVKFVFFRKKQKEDEAI